MFTLHTLTLLISFAIGSVVGSCLLWIYYKIKLGDIQALASSIIQKSEAEGEDFKIKKEIEGKTLALEHKSRIEQRALIFEKKISQEKEEFSQRQRCLEKRILDLEKKEKKIIQTNEKLQNEQQNIDHEHLQIKKTLEHLSGLSKSQAKELLIQELEGELTMEKHSLIRRIQQETKEDSDHIAQRLISTALNRVAIACTSESSIFTLLLPNEEMKGRIIGREGRNIRALEHATGVNFVIDDTPQAVILSSFDPIRRFIAKQALEVLISDGRIHPTRIEEVVANAQKNIKQEIVLAGRDAALKAKVHNLHPEIIKLLGELNFRYSYGQNILKHSLEVSAIMGLIAGEMGLNVALAKRIGLLHDMGKALSHEVEGTHAIVGHDFALKFGESNDVAVGIGCHHNEIPPSTIEGSFCGAADALSAARPGARVENINNTIKRLKSLEEISTEFPGVEKAYAMQAGREVRVVVKPDLVDDKGAVELARTLAKTFERRLTYPGKIKVTVIREKQTIEYAV